MAPQMASINLTARHATVYEPCDDSFALVDALHMRAHTIANLSPRICVEIGSGSGYIITSLALLLRSLNLSPVLLLATDINPHAAETTRETLRAHSALSAAVEDGRSSAVQAAADSTAVTMAATATSTPDASTAAAAAEGGQHSRASAVPFCADVVLTDVASAVDRRLAGCVDVIVCNPPYVVTPDEELLPPAAAPVAVPAAPETAESPADARAAAAAAAAAAAVLQPDALLSRAWAGGHRGRRVIDRILPRAASLLSLNGVFFLVVVAENEPREICSVMESRGFAWEAVLMRRTEEEKLTVLRFWRSC